MRYERTETAQEYIRPEGSKSDEVQGLRAAVDTSPTPNTEAVFQVTTAHKGKLSFLQWSLSGYTNHS